MTAEVISWEDAAAKFERDRNAFRLRLKGVSVLMIAQELRCTVGEVEGSLIRMCGGVSPTLRARTVEIELERLDELTTVFFTKASEGDSEACAMVIRLMERRARLLGLDIQPRGESALDEHRPQPVSSTDKIMEALNRLAHGPVIEGEVVDDAGPVPDRDPPNT